MKVSEFDRAVVEVFGEAYGRILVRETVLPELGNRTARDALAAGVPTRDVWLALCRSEEVPRSRWHGAGLPEPRA
ncbi:MAG TPA: DUF3046 domain-containing protein [Pseudolysinimonas sp.]